MSHIKEERQGMGLCEYCGGTMDREGITCITCNKKANVWKHTANLILHEKKLCTNCRKPMDRDGWLCKSCGEKLRGYNKKRNDYRRANGLCLACGNPVECGRSWCRACLDKRMERYYSTKGKKNGKKNI